MFGSYYKFNILWGVAVALGVCASLMMGMMYVTHSSLWTLQENRDAPSSFQKNDAPVRQWAYAFYLGGIPTLVNQTERQQAGYRGLLYNILVSVSNLKQQQPTTTASQAQVDFVLLVHMAEPYASLPQEDAKMLHDLNITVLHVPPTLPSPVNGFTTLALERFRILDLLQYSRVLYLDPDVTPYCSLNYLFELSEPQASSSNNHNNNNNHHNKLELQENVVISIADTPASSALFMLRPYRGHYQRFLRIFADHPDNFVSFNTTRGWGHKFSIQKEDTWESIWTMQVNKEKAQKQQGGGDVQQILGVQQKWSFPGADMDPGLLYHWVRYIRKKASIVVKDRIYHYHGKDPVRMVTNNPLQNYSCLPQGQEHNGGIGAQWYSAEMTHRLKPLASPFGVAPYRDFAQWQHNDNKPWHYAKAPDWSFIQRPGEASARRQWFVVLRELDTQHGWGLFPKEQPTTTNDDEDPKESTEVTMANWRYIVKRIHPPVRLPIWSTKVHAFKQWAKQQTEYVSRERFYKPPLLQIPNPQVQGMHRRQFTGDLLPSDTSTSTTATPTLPIPCNCSTLISLDPCSLPPARNNDDDNDDRPTTLEEWVAPRLGLKFSKHSPACPDAARHHMHVILPFANLELETIQAAYCSVQCQDYPPDRMTIYLYEDGSDNSNNEASAAASASGSGKGMLQQLCGSNGVVDVKPPFPATELALVDKKDAEFDNMAQEWADQLMQQYNRDIHPTKHPAIANTICLQSNERSGPGGAKYWAFRLVQAMAGANDVVAVVDGDDELNTPKALQVINRNYLEKSAWMTYGSYTGKYSEQMKAIPYSILSGQEAFRPRKDQPSWRFGHTRTFKAHLLRHMSRKDFAYKDGTWLIKATDRGFVYRMLELSGVDRVAYITEELYKYKWSGTASTAASVPKEIKEAHLQHVKDLEPSTRLGLPIHIVIVCWSRVYLLKEQLVWLQEQTLAENRQLLVHLLSNNNETHPEILQTAIEFSRKQKFELASKGVPIQIKIIENKRNWHAFSRFLYVDELRRTEPMDMVIFVDDDQYWVPNFLTSLLSYHRPKGMTTWYGKTFSKTDFHTGLADYWKSTDIKWSHIATKNLTEITTFTYGGPGGSVFDVNLWLFDQQLLRLKYDLQEYHEFDDVWVSYVIDALLGWEHRRLPMPIPVDIANCNHSLYNVTIFPLLPDGMVTKLLQLHEEIAHKLLSVATFSSGSRGSKTDMFEDLQRRFRWDVLRPNDSPLPRSNLETEASLYRGDMIGLSPMLPPPNKPKKRKRAFVCITGQFERLELKSKIATLLRPMIKLGYKVDLALVLSGGSVAFTNEGIGKMAKFRPGAKEKVPFYETFEDAVKELLKTNVTLVSPKDSKTGLYERLKNPKIHQQYLISLYEVQQEIRTFEEQVKRAENHPRIYESYQRCRKYAEEVIEKKAAKILKEDPTKTPPTMETYYDVYLRLREDIGFENRLSKSTLTSLLEPPPNSVTVTPCRGWHGMNDRFASVSPDIARAYFNRPYDIFVKGEELKEHIVNNPETFLLYAYLTAGIHVFGHQMLKGITRMYKKPDTGEAAFYADDLRREWCPKGPSLNHTDHLVSLYGWNL